MGLWVVNSSTANRFKSKTTANAALSVIFVLISIILITWHPVYRLVFCNSVMELCHEQKLHAALTAQIIKICHSYAKVDGHITKRAINDTTTIGLLRDYIVLSHEYVISSVLHLCTNYPRLKISFCMFSSPVACQSFAECSKSHNKHKQSNKETDWANPPVVSVNICIYRYLYNWVHPIICCHKKVSSTKVENQSEHHKHSAESEQASGAIKLLSGLPGSVLMVGDCAVMTTGLSTATPMVRTVLFIRSRVVADVAMRRRRHPYTMTVSSQENSDQQGSFCFQCLCCAIHFWVSVL